MFIRIGRARRLLTATLAAGALFAAAAGAEAQNTQGERLRPGFPVLKFAEQQVSGRTAVDRLGARLPEVAGWYGKSAGQLRDLLLTDRSVRLDAEGRMFVVEDLAAPLQAVTPGTQRGVADGQLSPPAQTFRLHSKPGSNRTIYLDFDGATLTGTAWNTTGKPITAKPFDIDGVVSTAFSAAELQRIQYIWQRVAEDYAPFDVDVTTEAPPADRLARSNSADTVFGTTVLITNNAGVYACTCGGIAYVGVFNSTTEKFKPALVFHNMLGKGDEKSVAEAISHEAGHNMGLSHDGTASAAYYSGQGADPLTAWAPIMGVGYYKPLVQFSRGEYAGANNREDDFAVAQSFGLPLRADDHGDTVYAAAPFSGDMQDGVIGRAGDVDMFAITANAGAFSATLAPATRSGNADLALSLLNAAGEVLATASPQNTLGAALSFQLPAKGQYFIAVRGTGQGDPAATGYSDYGSVGNFRLTARYAAAAGAPPNAVLAASATYGIAPAAIRFDASKSTDKDGAVRSFYWDFGDGTADNTGALRTLTKTYSDPGLYTARLTVVDNSGLRSGATMQISITAGSASGTPQVRPAGVSLAVSASGAVHARAAVAAVFR
ncbi:PKD domain-containing protein [Aestuariivirga sp.]|uniref:PKD domain-containing protein n=1 Tax=Aestuariivirga sp. TaxID=2650926 RepID=UPI0025C0FA73|nr:PKD domain-containing protein [Aestuariivirga sp.]MCA3555044.1 PKD domain-containing protein [Aestuariivirga sp.]